MAPIPALKNPKCTQCNVTFNSMSILDSHRKNVHGEMNLIRINRLTESIKEVLYPESVKSELSQKSLDCSECGLIFSSKEEQEIHLKQNCDGKVKENIQASFYCGLCEKPFERRGPMVNHRLLVHTVRTKDIHCDFCDEIFPNKNSLCSHITLKHGAYFASQEDSINNEWKKRKNLSVKLKISIKWRRKK